jgi:hypothetical protein
MIERMLDLERALTRRLPHYCRITVKPDYMCPFTVCVEIIDRSTEFAMKEKIDTRGFPDVNVATEWIKQTFEAQMRSHLRLMRMRPKKINCNKELLLLLN